MKKAALIAAAWAVCSPAMAQQHWQGADNFEIVELEGGCAVTAEYEAEGRSDTRFFLSHRPDEVSFALTSLDWTKPAGPIEVTIEFLPNGESYEGRAAPLTLESFYNGFVVKFDASVLNDFAAANSVRVMRGDVIVDHLSLSGSAATTATLRRCTAAAAAKEAARQRERERFSNIPKDPFAQ